MSKSGAITKKETFVKLVILFRNTAYALLGVLCPFAFVMQLIVTMKGTSLC
ncbi:hypothetical protein ACFLTP_09465 [Chloroflexota bacterium]